VASRGAVGRSIEAERSFGESILTRFDSLAMRVFVEQRLERGSGDVELIAPQLPG
jgi:hypothetical protein